MALTLISESDINTCVIHYRHTHTQRKYVGVFLYYKIIHLENSKHQTGQPKSLSLTMAAVFEPEVLFTFACMYPW